MTEGPYKLPEGWRWVRLGEVAKVKYGKAKPKGQVGIVPVIGSGGPFDITSEALVKFPTVVIGRKGSAGNPIFVSEPCWPSDTTFYLEWLSAVEPIWVWRWLTIHKPSPSGSSATLPSVRREDLEKHPIPLPPLTEQRRIVARIEALMERIREARRLREQAKQDAERLWQSVLAETFPRPGTDLPQGWRWVRLGEVAQFRQGFAFKASSFNKHGEGLPVIRIGDIDKDQCEVFYSGPYKDDLLVQPDDLLVGLTGSFKVRRWRGPVALLNQRIAVLRDVDEKVCIKNYIELFLPLAMNVLARELPQATVQNILTRHLRQTPIPLPPLEEQRRIVAHLEAVQERVQALKKAQDDTEAHLKELERAILDRAFRGEL